MIKTPLISAVYEIRVSPPVLDNGVVCLSRGEVIKAVQTPGSSQGVLLPPCEVAVMAGMSNDSTVQSSHPNCH